MQLWRPEFELDGIHSGSTIAYQYGMDISLIIIESCQKPLLPISSETVRGTAAKFCVMMRAIMG